MATRSIIAIQNEKEIKAIYCHYDGYLQSLGNFLLDNFFCEPTAHLMVELNRKNVLKFLSKGSLRSIYPIDLQNSNEKEVYIFNTIEQLKEQAQKNFSAEFIYLLDSDNVWNYSQISIFPDCLKFQGFKTLSKSVCK